MSTWKPDEAWMREDLMRNLRAMLGYVAPERHLEHLRAWNKPSLFPDDLKPALLSEVIGRVEKGEAALDVVNDLLNKLPKRSLPLGDGLTPSHPDADKEAL